MPIIMLFSQLCRRTVRGSTNLRPQFITFLLRPFMTQIAHFYMELAESLIDLKIFYIHVCLFHASLHSFGIESVPS
jgi:hypothetical protein